MHLTVKSIFHAPFEKVSDEVTKVKLFAFTSAPLLYFDVDSVDKDRWTNSKIKIHLKLLKTIPFGWHEINSKIMHSAKDFLQIEDKGRGQMTAIWDHKIIIKKLSDNKVEYVDSLTVKAGYLTLAVWIFSFVLFSHRHRRWKKLIKLGFIYDS